MKNTTQANAGNRKMEVDRKAMIYRYILLNKNRAEVLAFSPEKI
jgi:hypothetical protein